MDASGISQAVNRRNYCGKRRAKAGRRLNQLQAMAKEVTGNYATEMMIDYVNCASVELERWKREQMLQSLLLKNYRSLG